MDFQRIFGVGAYKGLHTAKHPLSLGEGMAFDARNLRVDPDGAIKVRNGLADVADNTGLPSGTFKGASEFYDDGTLVHVLLAWKEADNDVHIYRRQYTKSSTTWGDWILVTADSGKFGDTALTDPSNGLVQFWWCEAPADDQTLESYGGARWTYKDAPLCVISDGTKARIADLDVLVNGPELGDAIKQASHCNVVPRPRGNMGVVFDAYDWLDMSAAATPTGSGAGDWGTVNDTNSTWVFTTAAGSGTPAVLTGSDTADIVFDAEEITYAVWDSFRDGIVYTSLPRHFFMVATTTKDDLWENVDWSFSFKEEGGAYAWKAFPSAPLVLDTNVDTYKFVVFEFPDHAPASTNDLLVNGLRLTTRVTTPVSNTLTIYAMGAGGHVPGGTEYGIARRNRSAHTYSAGVVCHNTTFGVKKTGTRGVNLGTLDGTNRADFNGIPSTTIRAHSRALPNDFVLPVDSRVHYAPKVYYPNPSQDDLDTYAADYVAIYRKEPGESDFYEVERQSTGQYAVIGGWVFISGTAKSTRTFTDLNRADIRNFANRLPDESCIPPMPFMAGLATGGRGVVLENTNYGTQVRMSEYGQPLRFVEGVAVSDDTKGGFNYKIPREKGRAVAQSEYLGGNSESAQTVVFTDESAWAPFRMQGDVVLFDLRRVSSFGSVGPSVAEVDGTLCWMDKDREIRVLGLSESLSRGQVHDIFEAIPDGYSGITDLAYFRGRLYVAYTPSGQTENQRVAVYNVHSKQWECFDTMPADKEVQQFLNWRIAGANKLYYIDSTGSIREYEKASQTTDDGTAISFLLESGEYHNDFFKPVVAHRMGVVADKVSVTLNTTRTFVEPSSTSTGTIALSDGTDRAWKVDDLGSGSRIPGGESVGVRLKWDGSFSVACSFYSLMAEMDGGQFGGPRG